MLIESFEIYLKIVELCKMNRNVVEKSRSSFVDELSGGHCLLLAAGSIKD